MTRSLGGPAIVLAVVLAETAVGGLAVLWIAPLWGKVRPGFFKLAGAVMVACAVLAWLAARGPLTALRIPDPGGPSAVLREASVPGAASTAAALLAAFAALTVAWQLLFWFRAHRVSRWVGIAAVPVGAAALVAIALDPGVESAPGVAVFQVMAGALFAGAVTDGLLLGHWHLVDRRLGREPITRINQLFLAGTVLAAAAVLAGGTGGGEARPDLSPLLGVGVLTVAIAVGLAAVCALIGGITHKLIREGSLQSATGLLYLGVIMALAAEFAAKVRFF